jgi:KDO2-lipid IV(A) lauroyltransferase
MILLSLLSKISLWWLYRFSDVAYIVAGRLIPYRYKVVTGNLRNAFPEKNEAEIKQIARGFYRHFFDVVVESIALYSLKPEVLKKRVVLEGVSEQVKLLQDSRGIIVLTSHLGNWEWLLQACQLASPNVIDGVYKPLRNDKAEKWLYKLRARFGANPLPMKAVLRHVIKHKGETRALAMVADQTPPHSEIQLWTPFMHQQTACYVGGDKMQQMLKVPVIAATMLREKRGYYRVQFQVLDKTNFPDSQYPYTLAFYKLLEEKLQEQPAQWLWSHKRWKHKEAKVVNRHTEVRR